MAGGLVRLVRGQGEAKAALAGMQAEGRLEGLTRLRIGEAYRRGLARAVRAATASGCDAAA
jgi:hypothetical protein